ncbi:unnamed protein product [Pieris macdunnoughi]|uniref:Uncharacterized protein n=1 Tax=Pieris macdunnoughi TaxID=345717 RepID=A0A821TS80_9NEOP|nr:unnamed protein product [Pieris macdunnoughi]
MVWAPYEAKYSLMLVRIQNKFTRYLYKRLYGVYPLYPLMYPTLFVLGMVGYDQLRLRRELALSVYVFKILTGRVHNLDIMEKLSLRVPSRNLRRKSQLLDVPRAHSNLVSEAPLTRAIIIINRTSVEVDLFVCTLAEFTRVASYIISYKI